MIKQGPDTFGSEYAQNFVSCLHFVMKMKGEQDEEAAHSMFESSVTVLLSN